MRSLFEIHGTAYMVMDFESGASLSELLRDGKTFDEASLLALIKPIAEGLDRAHQAGVLHRDIKPANILVDDTGRSVLIDFGSARFDSGQATSTKVTFYTPPYAAIEQYVKTYPQGPWTDIYALGVVMYQCVTGEKPPEVLERMHGGLGEALASKPRPGFSRAFTRAVDAAMAIQPSARPQSIGEWLKLFDAPDADVEDDATRVVVAPKATPTPTPAQVAAAAVAQAAAAPPAKAPPAKKAPAPKKAAVPPPQPPPAAPAAAAAPAASAPAARAPAPAPATPVELAAAPPNRLVWILIAGGAAAVAIAAAGILLLHPTLPHFGGPKRATAPVVASASAAHPASGPAAVVATPGAPIPDVQPLAQAADQLAADARRMGRGRSETAALADSDSKINALAAQVKALPAAGGAQAAPLIDQMNTLALGMAHNEAAAVGRSAAGQMGSLTAQLGSNPQGAAPLAAARRAKSNLDAAVANASHVADPIAALGAARQTLAAYGAFAAAYGAASRVSVAAKVVDNSARQLTTLESLDSAAHGTSAAVVALANSNRPGLFASRARKDAYKLLQSNSGRAQADVAQLDQLLTAARADPTTAGAAVSKAAALKAELNSLYGASYAAAHASDTPAAPATTQ